MKIDAHHHFWKYDPVEYAWIGEDMSVIRRDFLPADLAAEIKAAGIDGVISVQARQTVAETARLVEFARENRFIQAVVGWVPLVSGDVAGHLEIFASEPKVRGMRHVLQGEADDQYMLREDFCAGIRALGRCGLVYDLLIFERQLPPATVLVDRHPAQVFVLDHIAKPRIKEGGFEPWRTNLRKLAERENVFCKLSGLVTEANWSEWTEEQLMPYVETVLAAFGPERTMFGSDWPVCLVASGYGRWLGTVEHFALALGLSDDEKAALFGGTASRAYRLPATAKERGVFF